MTKLPLAAGLALMLAGPAFAAGIPSYAPPPPAFTWTGLYGGVNIGYGFGTGDPETGGFIYPGFANGGAYAGTLDLYGVLGGGQIGFNYQVSPWFVIGLEADIQAADLNAQRDYAGIGFGTPQNAATAHSAKHVDWFGTVRGRLGVTFPGWSNVLIYGTGGFAYGFLDHSVSISNFFAPTPGFSVIIPATPAFSVNGRTAYADTAIGWTVGGGAEWSPTSFPSWSVKLEYLYTDFGNLSHAGFGTNFLTASALAVPVGPWIGTHNTRTSWHTVRAGLNWHFNPFATAPVLVR